MDPFVEQLNELCTAHPTRAKWVFVPSHALGRTLGDRLVLEGTNWANLRFVTPLDVALRMGAPFLVERGVDPSGDELGPALMMRLLLTLPAEGGYFRPLADQPTLAQAIWATIGELRMASIDVRQVAATAFECPAKHAELVALVSAYEQFLANEKRADMAAVYEEALRHPEWCPIQPQDCWTHLPDAVWAPLQQALLAALPGERITPRAISLPGVSAPRRLSSQGGERQSADAGTNPLAFLMAPAAASPPSRGANPAVNLFHAGGREAEVDEVFRRIVFTGTSLDQVEIACASDAHMALVWEKALRHDWPVTLGSGVPAAFTRPARALLGLCDWIETDFAAGHLRQLLQSGDLRVEEHEGFTAGQAARVLARAEAGWGRATYGLALGRLRATYEARAKDPDASEEDRSSAQGRASQAARVRTWITGLVASVPEPDADGTVPLQAVVTSALDFLERRTARSSALDHRAAASILEFVSELRALGAFSCTLPQALRFVRERVHSLHVAPERPRPGHLYACGLSQAGYAGRPHVFVVGLEEGRVFSTGTEDAVLLDAERVRISPDLRLATDRVDEAVYRVLSRLAMCNGSVTFSYSCRDTREFRDTYASWLMLQAFRLGRGDDTLQYGAMHSALGDPRSVVPSVRDHGASDSEWWVRSVVGTGQTGAAALGRIFQDVARGARADALRDTDDFTAYDGCVPDAGAVLDPCSPSNTYSVTELERAAQCPFRFFLKRGLGLRPPGDRERDRDVWLDPLTRGAELHAVYAALLERMRDEKRRPREDDRTWLVALAKARLDRLRQEMPAPTTEILERETSDFLSDVGLFLDAELEAAERRAIAIEVSFGRPLEDGADPLAREEPVEVPLGTDLVIRVAGRIDRIDEIGEGCFEVVDYKTGTFWPDKWKGVFAKGTRLQHALYGLAAVEILKARCARPRVSAGVYYFMSHRGGRERVRIPARSRADIEAVLGDLRAVVLTGQFIRTADAGNCRYCDYAAACGGDVNGQAERKVLDPRFPAFGRLSTHE